MKLQLRIESAAISIAIRCGMLRRIAFSREDDTEPEDVVAAVPKSGTPEASSGLSVAAQAGAGDGQGARPAAQPETERAPGRRVSARRLLAAAAVALAVALLFLAYLRVSRTYPENSDESNDLLMAWDMLHGNVLLHGWYLSDVSFITTELPQYALLVWLFGLHADTAHIAAAMTYTVVVILSVLLARGRVPRREARLRMLLTAALMFAPQLGVGVFVLLLSLGHIGTAVPLLLTWLVIDRCPPRRWVPVLVGLLLTWVLIADSLVLLVGVVPLVAVCALRVSRDLARRQDTSVQAVLRARWYELSLAVAAIAAQGLASLAGRLLQAYIHPLAYQLAPVHTWARHAWVTGKGLLVLFGAKPEGPPATMAFALLHLAGVALVAWAVLRVARRFLSWPDMISQILLVAMVLNVVAYVPSTLANATDLNAREFAVVLPFGAVLAGRTLAASLQAGLRRRPRPAVLLAGALLACYAAGLGYAAAQPSVPPMNDAAREVPGRAPPDQRHRRLLGVERGNRRQRRSRDDPGGRLPPAGAVPVGGQELLVRPRPQPGEFPGHQQQARILQPLAAQTGRAGGAGPSGQDVSHRPLHRVRLRQEPAG